MYTLIVYDSTGFPIYYLESDDSQLILAEAKAHSKPGDTVRISKSWEGKKE